MHSLLRISEATSIAIHSMAYIASKMRLVQSREIVSAISVSDTHLAKILQTLVKNGLINSIRGPNGGFKLTKDPDNITLLDIYESIEGRHQFSSCLLSTPTCTAKKCVLGRLVLNVNNEVISYFSKTTLKHLRDAYRRTNET